MRSGCMVLVLAAACGGGGSGDKVVFVTAADFDGGFGDGQAGTIDAAALADTQCQNAAQGAGLDGTFVAWLSRGGTNELAQRNAIDVVSSEGPWRTTTGEMAFLNHSALINTPQVPVNRNEHGDTVEEGVWTGTQVGGTLRIDLDCFGWHSSSATGFIGYSFSNDSDWTDSATNDCSSRNHLYCFEL